MCGIGGIFQKNIEINIQKEIRQMMDTLAHRGPDDEGYALVKPIGDDYEIERVAGETTSEESLRLLKGKKLASTLDTTYLGAFGHRRLSIYDLSASGHQPMSKGQYSIVFNGAIYNYLEIRNELEKEGFSFDSHSDTEVILAGYIAWGDKILLKLDGMYSFAILDLPKRKIFASRDILGVKPFYYVDSKDGFAFASEQKALYPLALCSKRVSKTAVFEYLVKGKLEERTSGLVKAVEELLPGHCLEYYFDTNNAKTSEWYKLSSNEKREVYKSSYYKRHKEKVHTLLMQAVELRLQADVQIGACLSGGLDSSAIVSIATFLGHSQGKKNIYLPTFTSCFPNYRSDESQRASTTAKLLGIDWKGTYPTKEELQSDLRDLIITHDLPLETPSTYAQYRVMKLASEAGLKVTLDGQGADELFGGYASHYQAHFIELLQHGEYLESIGEFITANSNFASKAQIAKTILKRFQGVIFRGRNYEKFYRSQFPELSYLRSSIWERQKHRIREEATLLKYGLNAKLTSDLKGSTMRSHLRIADRNSMRFGVESRLPFADCKELIEYVQNIPSVYKIRNQQNKSILRSAIGKYIPAEVLRERNKIGFEGPNKEWIAFLAPQLKEAILAPGMDEFLHNRTMYKNWDYLFERAMKLDPHKLFRFAALGLWMKEFHA